MADSQSTTYRFLARGCWDVTVTALTEDAARRRAKYFLKMEDGVAVDLSELDLVEIVKDQTCPSK